jgi:hypothetical protein
MEGGICGRYNYSYDDDDVEERAEASGAPIVV